MHYHSKNQICLEKNSFWVISLPSFIKSIIFCILHIQRDNQPLECYVSIQIIKKCIQTHSQKKQSCVKWRLNYFYVFFLCSLLFKLCSHYDHWRWMFWNRTIVSVQEYMSWLLTLQGGSINPTIRYLNVGIPLLIWKKSFMYLDPL